VLARFAARDPTALAAATIQRTRGPGARQRLGGGTAALARVTGTGHLQPAASRGGGEEVVEVLHG
jgi:hypothetical protein